MFSSKVKRLVQEILLIVILIILSGLILQFSINVAPNNHSLHLAASLVGGGLISYGVIRLIRVVGSSK